jgi:hypothetical protein
MSTTYDGALGTTVTVRPVGSSVTVGFDSTIVLVGPDDSSNGTASNQDAIFLDDRSKADDEFGSDSEIAKGFTAARENGAADIYGVSVDSGASDPDYTSAVQEAMGVDPRYVCILADTDTEISEARAVVTDYETDLEFTRLFAPGEDTSVSDISTYSARDNDQRYIEVSPATCTNGQGESTFTAAAVCGKAARKPLGSSLAFDSITVDSLGVEYRPSEASDFDKVTAVTKDELIVDGVTTSSESAFSDIFQMEIVDTVALGLDEIATEYAGRNPNTEDDRDRLAGDARIYLESLASQSPPLLADASGGQPYAVTASLGSNDTEVDLEVGINPVDVMKQINIDMDVGDVTRFNGVSA